MLSIDGAHLSKFAAHWDVDATIIRTLVASYQHNSLTPWLSMAVKSFLLIHLLEICNSFPVQRMLNFKFFLPSHRSFPMTRYRETKTTLDEYFLQNTICSIFFIRNVHISIMKMKPWIEALVEISCKSLSSNSCKIVFDIFIIFWLIIE